MMSKHLVRRWLIVMAMTLPAAPVALADGEAATEAPANAAGASGPVTEKPAEPDAELKTAIDRASYFYGLQVGLDLARRGFTDLDPTQIARGVKDAMDGNLNRFSQQQIHEAMIKYQQHLKDKQEQFNRAMRDMGQRNRLQGKAFLEDNGKKEGVVTTGSGLQYKVLRKGDGVKPTRADTVVAHYRGNLLDGSEFDSSFRRGEPLEIALADVIEGWQEALSMMPVGSRWMVYVPPDLGYKDSMRGPGGPGSTLIFEIELLDVKPAADEGGESE